MTESTNNPDASNRIATANDADGPSSGNSGKVLIVGIVLVALLMSGYAWWHQKQKGRRTLEFWGSRIALQLRYGKEIELLKLAGPGTSDQSPATEGNESFETLEISGQPWEIVQTETISKSTGLVHARQALVFDPSYDWDAEKHKSPDWQYALRFASDPGNSKIATDNDTQGDAILLFDLEHSVAGSSDGSKTVQLKIADGLKKFFEEKLESGK